MAHRPVTERQCRVVLPEFEVEQRTLCRVTDMDLARVGRPQCPLAGRLPFNWIGGSR